MKEKLTLEKIASNPEVQAYLKTADDMFKVMGYKEHGSRHAMLSANIAGNIMKFLDYPDKECELAKIAGYLHDIGNAIGQRDHAQNGGVLTLSILEKMKIPYGDIFPVISAIGSHEDKDFLPPSAMAAAVILGDKTDVHHTRVRSPDFAAADTHARVNAACQRAFMRVIKEERIVSLELTIDIQICSVMDYFEIFLSRTKYCRSASRVLGCEFELYINKDKFL
ncbi:MAG: HD domain-containing protein [Elusimicrobiota bacterium]